MPTITRKIQLNFDVEDKKELKALYEKWFSWQHIVQRAANFIATHQYLLDHVRELFYFTEDTKVKLLKEDKDIAGILTTSRDNATYQILSKNFKGEAPMGMLSGLNTVIAETYKKESKDVRYGKKSLRTYRNHIPMPVRFADTANWTRHEDGNYSFSVYGTDFKTWFGFEKHPDEETHKQTIMDRALLHGEQTKYKLCDSTISIERTGKKRTDPQSQTKKSTVKIYLNAVFSIPAKDTALNVERVADCWLSEQYPIVIKEKSDKMFTIGTAEEYLHRRLQIKEGLRRLRIDLKYNPKRDGRKLKLQGADRYELLERDYVDHKMHVYSRRLIDYCLKRGIGKIILNNYQEAVEDTHQETEESKFLLATWSYYNLSDKIKYKAAIHGIVVEVL